MRSKGTSRSMKWSNHQRYILFSSPLSRCSMVVDFQSAYLAETLQYQPKLNYANEFLTEPSQAVQCGVPRMRISKARLRAATLGK
jgi:hypothetical protein